MRRFMQAGPRRGLLSAWQRKSGQRTLRRMPRQSTRAKWCSPSVHPTTVLRSISAEKAIWPPLSTAQVGIYNVTFEPGCRNNWHIHHAAKGGGQILVCVAGRGYYQEWGKAPRELHPGDVVNIPPEVKHWHGAAPDCWFSHLAVEVPGEGTSNEWCEPVPEETYKELR